MENTVSNLIYLRLASLILFCNITRLMSYTIAVNGIGENSSFDTACFWLPSCIPLCPSSSYISVNSICFILVLSRINIIPKITTACSLLIERKTNHILLRAYVLAITLPSFFRSIHYCFIIRRGGSLFTTYTINLYH